MLTRASRAINNIKEKEFSLTSCCSCGILSAKSGYSGKFFRPSTSNKSNKRVHLLSRSRSAAREVRSASSEENLFSEAARKRRSRSVSDKDNYGGVERGGLYDSKKNKAGIKERNGVGDVRHQALTSSNINLTEVPPTSQRSKRTASQAAKARKEVQGLWLEQQQRMGKELLIADTSHKIVYRRGKLLGKGGFAKCYKLTHKESGNVYAGKVISRGILSNPREREKILREIELHRSLQHKNVVAFQNFFEDDENVYIVLEYCSLKSLDEVIRRRKFITEPEVRFYMRQLINGCSYIHSQLIIHRDLKLGNMLLTAHMKLKIADFGLATRVAYLGEKKMTVCGTPNYIAPEVLQQKGHSYPADIWALGCIMYAMLCGRPPFETSSLKETYRRIVSNDYVIPFVISQPASGLIRRFLNASPAERPQISNLMTSDAFFTSGFTPRQLSTDCCTAPPKFRSSESLESGNLIWSKAPKPVAKVVNKMYTELDSPQKEILRHSSVEVGSVSLYHTCEENMIHTSLLQIDTNVSLHAPDLTQMHNAFYQCLQRIPQEAHRGDCPIVNYFPVCVSKWVDYCNKYGFGYELSDGSVGILYNDKTSMLLKDYQTLTYVTSYGHLATFSVENVKSRDMKKKLALLLGFSEYMDNNLISGGIVASEGCELAEPHPTFIELWRRTSKAIVMYLQNGTVQVNFWKDHTKAILSTVERTDKTCRYFVTFVDNKRSSVTHSLQDISEHRLPSERLEELRYAVKMLYKKNHGEKSNLISRT